ncbi:hypothetical protein [Nocardioides conyzicola]
MRARLGAQRDAEELLVEASKLRGTAAEDADVIVAEAEALADQLLAEARAAADQVTADAMEAAAKLATEAQERADGILARAYYEAEDLQRHTEEERARIREEVISSTRAEIEEIRTRSEHLLETAEGGLRRIGPSLESAVTAVSEVLSSLEELRDGPADLVERPAGKPVAKTLARTPSRTPSRTSATRSVPEPEESETTLDAEAMVAEGAPPSRHDDPEARPLGWLFRASQA